VSVRLGEELPARPAPLQSRTGRLEQQVWVPPALGGSEGLGDLAGLPAGPAPGSNALRRAVAGWHDAKGGGRDAKRGR